ncbi:MAG: DUF433 domain-containing protein [Candidatus Kapabacteria bacterium]|nr:DUF433 domain-containing protein [Candidatus Kapabacteria bacterium]
MTTLTYPHISEEGILEGTTMRVTDLVAQKLAWGWSAEELHFQHPHITLGAVYSALAYYADHEEEINTQIATAMEIAQELRRNAPPSRFVERLKREGRWKE